MNGKETGKVFTKENQPTAEQRAAGWAKRKRNQELVKAILDLKFKGHPTIRKRIAQHFGIPEEDVTVEQAMIFRQASKAIEQLDTPAFNAIFDRAYGKPKESVKVENDTPLDKLPIEF